MEIEKRKKIAFSIWRSALNNGSWAFDNRACSTLVDCARAAVEDLDDRGCFDLMYGDSGSLEVAMTSGALCRIGVGYSHSDQTCFPTGGLIVRRVFEVVQDLDRRGLLNDDQRRASRAVAAEAERVEAAEKAAKAAADEKAKRKAADKAARDEKRKAAENRLEEIRKIKGGN